MTKENLFDETKGVLVIDSKVVARVCRLNVIHPLKNNEQKFMLPLVSYEVVL